MKMNTKLIILLLLVMSSVSSYAENDVNSGDPIGNSYIINSLQMESDTDPASESSSETLNGEIIFDNSFDDSLLNNKDQKKLKTANHNALKNLRKKDNRWHLVEYKVKKNDSIWKIAKKFNTESSVIISLNSLSPKGNIRETEILLVPSRTGVSYKIRRGDTLSSIAEKYNADIEKIAEHNNIDGKKIIAGRSIFIPDASERMRSEPLKEQKKVSDKTRYIASKKDDAGTGAKVKEEKNGKLLLAWPLRGPITSGFGYRTHPFSGQKKFHCGLDIGAEIGTTVRAAGSGKVIFSGWKGPYGNLIVIQHSNNYITVYAHNSKLLVENGEAIKKGQKVALSGKTGAVTGSHLHFEIRKGIVPLNPSRILK